MRVAGPNVHLQIEPARIIQTGCPDRGELRSSVGINHNRRAAVRAKASMSFAARLARRGTKTWRALGDLECFLRDDDKGRKRTATRSRAIATMAVKYESWFGGGCVANRAARASA